MNSAPFGNIARHVYTKWSHRQLSILEHQQKHTIISLTSTKNYIICTVLEDASEGAKFRRFYYNELDGTHTFKRTVRDYEIRLILDGEEFDITYEKDSFVVRWIEENSSTQLK